VLGGGVRGGYDKSPSNSHNWTAGIYGELGAVYFIVPHVSLGAVGEVHANYVKSTQDGGVAFGDLETTRTQFGASLVRVLLSVYF
jgi:hypothetical protein